MPRGTSTHSYGMIKPKLFVNSTRTTGSLLERRQPLTRLRGLGRLRRRTSCQKNTTPSSLYFRYVHLSSLASVLCREIPPQESDRRMTLVDPSEVFMTTDVHYINQTPPQPPSDRSVLELCESPRGHSPIVMEVTRFRRNRPWC